MNKAPDIKQQLHDYQGMTSEEEWNSIAKDPIVLHYNKMRLLRRATLYGVSSAIVVVAIISAVVLWTPSSHSFQPQHATSVSKSAASASPINKSTDVKSGTMSYSTVSSDSKVTTDIATTTKEAVPSNTCNTKEAPVCTSHVSALPIVNFTTPSNSIPQVQPKTIPAVPNVPKAIPNTSTTENSSDITVDINETYDYPTQDDPTKSQTTENKFFIPSAFTPNADGLNDIFYVKANFTPTTYELNILSKDGQQLFTARNIDIGWDGQLHGKIMPQGVYIYVIRYTDPTSGKSNIEKGQILLLH